MLLIIIAIISGYEGGDGHKIGLALDFRIPILNLDTLS